MNSGSGLPSPSSFWGFHALCQSSTLTGKLQDQLPLTLARTAPLILAPALCPDHLLPWLPRMRWTAMVGRNRAMAVDPLYVRRGRASVLTPVCPLADRFCPLTKSPAISCSVFTLSDPRLRSVVPLKNQLLWRFGSAFAGRSTHFAGLEWLAWILRRTERKAMEVY